MNVRFYGRLADLLGEEMRLDLPEGGSIESLRLAIVERHPEAGAEIMSGRVRALVGDTIVDETKQLSAADSVEFIPPVSGG
ncbi:MoaD/ThiS family protein [Sphingomonas sp. KRR8]|uniref:MoaD/ThiS family protein n=1 Tax=Sphingomonas sp. KRR8 TaxID=2942996 RepID=UPI0020205F28|nr:MoaD/ThiS family protein [Sphingomonas sp. KRR8]URD61155.1 MoaD/ThiS family protein [Sphingomonas sp. KRR8]